MRSSPEEEMTHMFLPDQAGQSTVQTEKVKWAGSRNIDEGGGRIAEGLRAGVHLVCECQSGRFDSLFESSTFNMHISFFYHYHIIFVLISSI